MKILSNYYNKSLRSTISEGLFNLLLAEISASNEESELILVSPWMRNIDFNTSSRGELRQILEHKPTKISMETLLDEYLKRGGRLKIICLPPHKLISGDELDTISELIEIREIVDDLEVQKKINDQITKHTSKVLGNQTMLKFIGQLKKKYQEKIDIIYNSRLHAKIYLGKYLGILGSSNMTHYGFNYSDEVCLLFNDEVVLQELRTFIDELSNRYHSEKLEDYSFSKYVQTPRDIQKMHPEIERLLATVHEYLSTKKEAGYYFDDGFVIGD